MNEKELFENFCFLPDWNDRTESEELVGGQCRSAVIREGVIYLEDEKDITQKKDLTTLLAELEEIKNNIENIKAKQWHLAKLIKFHKAGLSAQ